MIHALTAKNKIGFINGSIKVPSKVDQSAEYALWNRCNKIGFINGSIKAL